MGVRTAKDLAVEEACEADVGAILGTARDLVHAVMANGASPDDLILVSSDGGHYVRTSIFLAAFSTARTILS